MRGHFARISADLSVLVSSFAEREQVQMHTLVASNEKK
jgi:hypothetical protein